MPARRIIRRCTTRAAGPHKESPPVSMAGQCRPTPTPRSCRDRMTLCHCFLSSARPPRHPLGRDSHPGLPPPAACLPLRLEQCLFSALRPRPLSRAFPAAGRFPGRPLEGRLTDRPPTFPFRPAPRFNEVVCSVSPRATALEQWFRHIHRWPVNHARRTDLARHAVIRRKPPSAFAGMLNMRWG